MFSSGATSILMENELQETKLAGKKWCNTLNILSKMQWLSIPILMYTFQACVLVITSLEQYF